MIQKILFCGSMICCILIPNIALGNKAYDRLSKSEMHNTESFITENFRQSTPKDNNIRIKNSPLANMVEYDLTSLPIGFKQYCRDNQEDCFKRNITHADIHSKQKPLYLVYNEEIHREILALNTIINNTIESVSDKDNYNTIEYWTLPQNSQGDCEDYVLLKKQQLINKGVPEEVLRITVVRDEYGDGHAVLTLVTDIGDLILDNKIDDIRFWYETPYKYIKRQSQISPLVWRSLKKYS